MMNFLNIFTNVIDIYRRKGMLINYRKINEIPKFDAGYIDVEEVSKRYRSSAIGATINSLKKQTPVKEALYFILQNFRTVNIKLIKGKILDVGCGNGLYSLVLGDVNCPFNKLEYWGCEICDQFIDICKSINPRGNFFKSHAQKIDKKDNEFEVVYCSSTLHYTLNGWKESIKEMSRVCGKYLIFTRLPVSKYNKNFFVHQTVKTLSSTENHYFIVINRNELENEFLKNGLKIIDRDYSQEEYPIKEINEKIILVQYLLEK